MMTPRHIRGVKQQLQRTEAQGDWMNSLWQKHPEMCHNWAVIWSWTWSHNPKYYKCKNMPFKENSEITFLFPLTSFKLSGLKDKCYLLTFKSCIHNCHWISYFTWKCHIMKVKCIMNIHVDFNRQPSRY